MFTERKNVPLKTNFCANVLRNISKDQIILNGFSVNVTWWTLFRNPCQNILQMFPVIQTRQSALLCSSVCYHQKKYRKIFTWSSGGSGWLPGCCYDVSFLKKFLANFTISYKETASNILLNIKWWSRKTEMVMYCKTYSDTVNKLWKRFQRKWPGLLSARQKWSEKSLITFEKW